MGKQEVSATPFTAFLLPSRLPASRLPAARFPAARHCRGNPSVLRPHALRLIVRNLSHPHPMPKRPRKSWMIEVLRKGLAAGLWRAYSSVRVHPESYLKTVQQHYSLRIHSFQDMFTLPEDLIDRLADKTIHSSMRLAALEGTGMGLGGLATLIPDMGILSAIVLRMLQRLSLLYGFEYSTPEDQAMLWMAAASAAGLDLGREFIEKEAVERLVPRIIDRMAARMSSEMVEKWSGRIIPLLSGALGGALNYYFVRQWGRRAKNHLRLRHAAVRRELRILAAAPTAPVSPGHP